MRPAPSACERAIQEEQRRARRWRSLRSVSLWTPLQSRDQRTLCDSDDQAQRVRTERDNGWARDYRPPQVQKDVLEVRFTV